MAPATSDDCPATPLRHKFPQRSEAWRAVRGQNNRGETFRVYHCETCGAWHWHRIINLSAIRREGPKTTWPREPSE